MAAVAHHTWVFIFGLLGNIISFMVYIAPMPTFWRITRKKSTEEFKSLPYICAIFSSMLWIYYAFLKTNSFLLITINGVGCVIETIYVAIFLIYAPPKAKMATLKLIIVMNLVGFSTIVVVCSYVAKASIRVQLLGWICVAFAVVVFAAPLSIIRRVIRTKSAEFMPLPLSLSLTISAVMWFMYGLLQKDLYIVLPNVGGFFFGVAQVILYGIYRNNGKVETKDVEMKLPVKITCDAPVKIDVITLNAAAVRRPGKDDDEQFEDDNIHLPCELQVHGPTSCRVDEITMVGSTAPTTVQMVGCVA